MTLGFTLYAFIRRALFDKCGRMKLGSQKLYIYIYIYLCVCVCVCVYPHK